MRVFYEQWNIGKTKYVVNFHDGEKTHKDGSPFYDSYGFRNKVKKDRFVRALRADGYRERSL